MYRVVAHVGTLTEVDLQAYCNTQERAGFTFAGAVSGIDNGELRALLVFHSEQGALGD